MAGFELDPEFERKLKEASEPRDVPLTELMPPEFMAEHTSFSDIQEMFDNSPIASTREEDAAEALQSDEWTAYVREVTDFQDWNEMLSRAGAENIKKRLE